MKSEKISESSQLELSILLKFKQRGET